MKKGQLHIGAHNSRRILKNFFYIIVVVIVVSIAILYCIRDAISLTLSCGMRHLCTIGRSNRKRASFMYAHCIATVSSILRFFSAISTAILGCVYVDFYLMFSYLFRKMYRFNAAFSYLCMFSALSSHVCMRDCKIVCGAKIQCSG